MPKLTPIAVKLSDRQLRQLEKLKGKLELDRSEIIRLAIARLVEEESARNPIRDKIIHRNAR